MSGREVLHFTGCYARIMKLLKSNFHLLIVLSVALVLQLAFFSLLLSRFGWGSEGFVIGAGDPKEYLKLALNLLKYKTFIRFTEPVYILESYIPPLYPVFIAAFYKLFGQLWAVVLLQQIIFALPTLVIIWKIFEKVFDKRTAFLGALWVAIDTQRIILVNQFSAESLFLFLFFLFIYFIMSFVKRVERRELTAGTSRKLIFAGLFLGLAALARSFVLALAATTLVYLVFLHARRLITRRQLLKFSALFVGVVALVVSPWMTRNYYHFKMFKLSSSFEYVLYTRHVKRIQEYKLKQVGVSVGNFDTAISNTGLQEFKKDNNLERLSDAEAALLMWDAKYANYEFKKATQVIRENFGTYLNIWMHRVPGWFLDNDLGLQLAMVQEYFYPLADTLHIEPYQALWAGRFAFLALYVTIALLFLRQRRLFWERFNSLVFFVLMAGSFVFLAAMVYTPRHKLPLDFITYGTFIFVLTNYLSSKRRSLKSQTD